ncbi:YeiH family protein [Haladaptatus pallidirubidus]|uniref:YeiH family protein n=1 Tax=Haladaptatus pallidirubidus TaxID=1008152 RepID=A0AAV3UG87_9EURY|nr:putative sulfate exporter family transporter [Haladaptatus pallidirubidus]
MRNGSNLFLGVLLLFAIGVLGRTISLALPFLDYLIATILVGVLVGNTIGKPEWAKSGIETHKLWLEAGIVLMGASVAFDRVVSAGATLLLLVVGTVVIAVFSVELLARHCFGITEKTGSLLAAGSSICGVSAVVAVAGSIDANENQIAYAAGTVLLFDTLTLIAYPAFGHALSIPDKVFGIWAGLTMFSTGPATAVGFSISDTAGEWAVLVKLARNALIGIAATGYALYYLRNSTAGATTGRANHLWQTFPKFVFGFLFVMILANVGVVDATHVTSLKHASNWLFMLAFAGLGLELRLDELRTTGFEPIAVVLVSFVVVSGSVLALLYIVL